MQVEVVDEEALQLPYCFPIRETDRIFLLWDTICDRIIRSFNNLNEWNALECYRYGKDSNPSNNCLVVILSVSPLSRSNWTPVRNQIVAILDEFGLWDVAVYINPDQIVQGTHPFDLQERVLPPETACQ